MPNLEKKQLFLLDMDGTIYLGNRLFPGTVPFLNRVLQRGGRYLFLTNNSSKSTDAYIEKLARLGISATADNFYTSTDATLAFLNANYAGKTIYPVGTATFVHQLAEGNFKMVDGSATAVDAVVVANDTELTFAKLEAASRLLTAGADFIATNPDPICPTEFGSVPDCGSICQMLTNATGKTPRFIGKPQPEMVLAAIQAAGTTPDMAVVVGDRLYTDIACGKNAGIDTVLVLSGEATMADVENSKIKPNYILQDIGALATILA